jgi:hypothetical protein
MYLVISTSIPLSRLCLSENEHEIVVYLASLCVNWVFFGTRGTS